MGGIGGGVPESNRRPGALKPYPRSKVYNAGRTSSRYCSGIRLAQPVAMLTAAVRSRSSVISARLAVLLAMMPRVAHAHTGRAPGPHDLWEAWTQAPAVVLGCAFAAWLYWRGVRAFRRRAGRGRTIILWRRGCFAAGIIALLVALASPLDAMAAALFSAHMVQHLLLMMVAAPLLVLGDAGLVSLWGVPVHARRRIGAWWLRRRGLRGTWRMLASAPIAWTLHVAALWAWHLPSMYDRALASEWVHVLEHATFLATALLFWWVLFAPHGRRLGAGSSLVYLFGAALQSTMLGAVLALARHPLYTAHFGTTRAWGFTALEDQQLAGLLMWVPAGIVYLLALVPPALRVLRETSQRERRLAVAGASARGTP